MSKIQKTINQIAKGLHQANLISTKTLKQLTHTPETTSKISHQTTKTI